ALKSAVLRNLKRPQEALAMVEEAMKEIDPLDERLMAEHWLTASQTIQNLRGREQQNQLASTNVTLNDLKTSFSKYPSVALEAAAAYGDAGLWKDGGLLFLATLDEKHVSPLAYYYYALFCEAGDKTGLADAYRKRAAEMSPEYVFP